MDAVAVGFVSDFEVLGYSVQGYGLLPSLFGKSPFRSLTGLRIEKKFDLGIRKNDGSDVAPFENHPALCSNRAPKLDEVSPELFVNGDLGRSVRDRLLPNGVAHVLPVEKDALETLSRELDPRIRRQSGERFAVVQVNALAQRFERDGPERSARIQIDQGQPLRDIPGRRGLSGAGGPVDRDDGAAAGAHLTLVRRARVGSSLWSAATSAGVSFLKAPGARPRTESGPMRSRCSSTTG